MDFCPNPNRSRRLMRVPQASESLRTLFCRRGPRDFALFYVEMADFAFFWLILGSADYAVKSLYEAPMKNFSQKSWIFAPILIDPDGSCGSPKLLKVWELCFAGEDQGISHYFTLKWQISRVTVPFDFQHILLLNRLYLLIWLQKAVFESRFSIVQKSWFLHPECIFWRHDEL